MSIPVKTMRERIDRTFSRLPDAIYTAIADLKVEAWVTREPVSYADRMSGKHRTVENGEVWGELWDCAWMRFTGNVPDASKGKDLVLIIDFSGEGLVVDPNGEPLQGLTTVASVFDYSLGKPGKKVVPYQGSGEVDLWVDAALNDLFGYLRNGGKLMEAHVAVRCAETLALLYDFEVLRELLDQVPDDTARHAQALQALYEASTMLTDLYDEAAVASARQRLSLELAKKNGDPSLTISAVGHAHIDLAWLWPIRETIRKGARTFSTVMRMMERYPDYVFGASQPQLYQWMKDHYPSVYAQIQQREAEGRWEVQGAMWVEPDANLPSGESLVRQLLYGKRFFRQEFGKDVRHLWEPDVFGYSGSLPQILLKADVDVFMTQKLSWSQFNQHPHQTFWWEGIDGSRVLVHMPPEETYNSSAAPRAIAKAEKNYRDKGVSDRCLLLFGIGDGGGGPGEEHLERLSREKNLAGLAPVVQEHAAAFFERIKQGSERYSTWRGELYLEKHQGTFTTQGRNKRFNRKIEFALRELELASVRAMAVGHPYPKDALDRIWKEVLLLQFHDILPGSSITRVYTESLARYEELMGEVIDLTAAAEQGLAGGNSPVVANALSWPRSEWVRHDGRWYKPSAQELSYAALGDPMAEPPTMTATPALLENERLRVAFSEAGDIVSILDKEANRELLREAAVGNLLSLYDDPGDAWDFAVDYDQTPAMACPLTSVDAFVDGPEATVRQTRSVGSSTVMQEIVLAAQSRRLEFRTTVDWKERHKMLRTSFPVDLNADVARCDIQFGSIERPLHGNTSWEWAKGEICAHKWVDISETGYGVALLNDCKYGHRVLGGVLDLNLLRSPSYPDPVADEARHQFTYALYPHLGDHIEGDVVREAFALNVPLRVVAGEAAGPFLSVDAPNVIVDTVKRAEDGDAVVVRLYEAHGKATTATLSLGFECRAAALVNLMEEHPEPLALEGRNLTVKLSPFEIVTVLLEVDRPRLSTRVGPKGPNH